MFLIGFSDNIIHQVDCQHWTSDEVSIVVITHEVTKVVVVGEADTDRVAGVCGHWKLNTDSSTEPFLDDILLLSNPRLSGVVTSPTLIEISTNSSQLSRDDLEIK